jgi:hypothetical protein
MHAKHRHGSRAKADRNGLQHGLQSPAEPGQLTLNFEPSLAERFETLRDFIAFRIQELQINEKHLAVDMDLSPTSLSRKLRPKPGDTSAWTSDDTERYIAVTRDTAPIEYLASKFIDTPEARKARAIARCESVLTMAQNALRALQEAG